MSAQIKTLAALYLPKRRSVAEETFKSRALLLRFLPVQASTGATRCVVLSIPRDAGVVSVYLKAKRDLRVKYLIVEDSSKVIAEPVDSPCDVSAEHHAADAGNETLVFAKPLH